MFNESFFVMLAFTVFLLLAMKPIIKLLNSIATKYSQQVGSSIAEANKLREEANIHLKETKEKSDILHEEVQSILEQAKKEAQLILEEARIQAEKIIEHRSNLAVQRITHEEVSIQNSVRNELVTHVLNIVEHSLLNEMDKKTEQDLAENSIANFKKNMH